MKVLVLGSKGQLGKCLRDRLETSDHDVIYLSRQELDITELERSRIKISSIAFSCEQSSLGSDSCCDSSD